MHSRHHNDGPRPNVLVRAFRGLVFLALLPAILVAGVILLPVFVIAPARRARPARPRLPRPPRTAASGEPSPGDETSAA